MSRLKRLDATLLDDLSRQALTSPRLRDNFNFHPRPDDQVQRLCIALEPESYVRPHRHPEAEKWEFLVALRGRLLMLLFDDAGCVTERMILKPAGGISGIEIEPNTWHTLLAEVSGTVILEVKQGPYIPVSFSNFADWSPRESSNDVARYQSWCRTAQLGGYYR